MKAKIYESFENDIFEYPTDISVRKLELPDGKLSWLGDLFEITTNDQSWLLGRGDVFSVDGTIENTYRIYVADEENVTNKFRCRRMMRWEFNVFLPKIANAKSSGKQEESSEPA